MVGMVMAVNYHTIVRLSAAGKAGRVAERGGQLIASVLIANRGEIAVRLIRTYRALGVRTVAVYSDADAGALHVRLADQAIRIGLPPVTESYLNSAALVAAADESGAKAVDPGYGLLSENPGFARAVRAAGLIFIGPPSEAIAVMGDKPAAHAVARRAGVPVVPSSGVITSAEQAEQEAARLGYPVVVKASFGGGGRGMRVVADAAGLAAALTAAGAEAAAAFGRGEVYLERHVPGARHVEVQVLADSHGTVLTLGDRDCSVQRRHQKLIEEAPAPFLPEAVRTALAAAAAALAAEVGYTSTGTAEFLYAPASGEFFFLEMNTRLQVEHGVTELVTGIDLVEHRLAVALGEPLELTQDDVRVHGHAIEVRLAAEDPWQQFRPAPGAIAGLQAPAGPWLRADLGVAAGDRVPREYDSMFGKLMAWGPDREVARRRLVAALAELRVEGLASTGPYLRQVLGQPAFVRGEHATTTLEQDWQPDPGHAPPVAELAAPQSAAQNTARVVEVRASTGAFRISIHGQPRAAGTVAATGRGPGRPAGPGTPAAAGGAPVAPMDGVVVKVAVIPGEVVERHAVLVVLEAMKMQIPVTAPAAGTVQAVLVAPGDSVTTGQPLAQLDNAAG
jgi:acetyl-CoA/propionyl-CoA carboxylase, biotin carboxylase, biotin carboxyl carrier protein